MPKLEAGKNYQANNDGVCFRVNKVFKNGKIDISTFNGKGEKGFIEERVKMSIDWFSKITGECKEIDSNAHLTS